ncbi:PP2C family serine/threonine-protein phosphatase [Peribacillus acanthi]|uniref:PP2C family serine/threonine-protein phosphatase n=1 Tax=Peribacillus acanthi TaxID=2171554 RepID=UPI000D3ED3CE|nr:PP2C family serine/threonine-protein phosphatase [Peribacillus acanthi]
MIQDDLSNSNVEVLVRQTSKKGDPYCGDSFFYTSTDEYFICVLADGLGSGKYANESSAAVINAVKQHHSKPLVQLMDICNKEMINKRGAAVSIIKMYYETRTFEYISVGNIKFFLYNHKVGKMLYPLPVTGYLSGRKVKMYIQTFEYEAGSRFILFSDGLELREIKAYLNSHSPLDCIADTILDSNTAQSDDMTFILGSLQ